MADALEHGSELLPFLVFEAEDDGRVLGLRLICPGSLMTHDTNDTQWFGVPFVIQLVICDKFVRLFELTRDVLASLL